MEQKMMPKVLIISSADPFRGPGRLAWDNYLVLKEYGIDVDLLTMYKTDNPDVISVFENDNSDGFIFKLKYCRKSLKDRVFQKIGLYKESINGYHFFYREEKCPPVDEKWVLKKITKKYDLVVVLFWQRLLSFSTIEKIYDKLNCQIHFRFVDYSPMSGGCHFTMDCVRYKDGCGQCPAFCSTKENDFTRKNVEERDRIYKKLNPVIYGNTYMQSFYKQSFLLKKMQYELSFPIINESDYCPRDRTILRNEFNILIDKKFIALFGCQSLNDERKGMKYLYEALRLFYKKLNEEQRQEVLLLVIGQHNSMDLDVLPFDYLNLGYVDYHKLAKIYAVSDVFLSPSVYDAGPMMVNQSLSCGTPVVAFDMGVAVDVIKDKGTGYCAKLRSSKDFACGIECIYSQNEEEKEKMRNRCRKIALQTTSRAARVENLLEVYKKNKR